MFSLRNGLKILYIELSNSLQAAFFEGIFYANCMHIKKGAQPIKLQPFDFEVGPPGLEPGTP